MPLRYIYAIPSRHGQARVYFWRGAGTGRVRIREAMGTPEFATRYAALLAASAEKPIPPQTSARHGSVTQPGTFGDLVQRYQASSAFARYDFQTVRKRRHLLSVMIDEPIFPGSADTFRAFPLERLTTDKLAILRDRAAETVGQANERVKALRAMFKWATDPAVRLAVKNPALDLRVIRVKSEGWHTWTLDEIDRFEARHPAGTKAHLALQILLYTGARRSDVYRLGRPHLRDDMIRWTAHKGRNSYPTVIEIECLPPLRDALARGPVGDVTWLVTEHGRPFTHAGFGNWFRDRCNEAGLPHCSAHGLRKAGATRAAENGATAHMLMAMFGWKTLAEAERYTRAAERKRLARVGSVTLMPRARDGQ